jgi:hypothetical protein
MGLKKKQKKLDWWIANFGEEEGRRQYLSFVAHKRKRTLEFVKAASGVSLLLKAFGK